MTFTIARQMVGAEVLKLRRNRALMGFSFVLSVVVIVIFFGYTAIEHSSNPTTNPAAGGMLGFQRSLRVLGLFFGSLVAILIGTEAGTADRSSGVFRDLVATGRSRLSLFAVRAPAAIAVTLAFTISAYLVALIGTYALAASAPTPSLSLVLQGLVWIVVADAVVCALAVGVGSITGSRGVTLTGVIGWQTIATQLIGGTTSLGSVRDGLLTPALSQLMPITSHLDGIAMATGTALAVAAVWVLVPTALGAWRTRTLDA
jgi:hypothetical protein